VSHVAKGQLAELMVQVNPKLYQKYITTNKKGEAILASKTPITTFLPVPNYNLST